MVALSQLLAAAIVARHVVWGERPDVKRRFAELKEARRNAGGSGIAAGEAAQPAEAVANTTTTATDAPDYGKPGGLLQREIDRARAAESSVQSQIEPAKATLMEDWDMRKMLSDTKVLEALAAVKQQSLQEEEAFGYELMNLTENFKKVTLGPLVDKTTHATAERNFLQSQINGVWNSLVKSECQPSSGQRGTVPGKAGMMVIGCGMASLCPDMWPGSGCPTDMDSMTRFSTFNTIWHQKFDTFEEAWLRCGETAGCGHILELSTTPGQTLSGSAADGTSFSLDISSDYTGFFMRRRYDLDIGTVNASWNWGSYVSCLSNLGVPMTMTGAGNVSTVVTGTDYVCEKMCPAACQQLGENSTACGHCAEAIKPGEPRACSTCNMTHPNGLGCSGMCMENGQVDCRYCPSGRPLNWRR
eukprot:TRINITY_DN32136_c0_g1_i1.p1 TRINITY_DN32136_c0_g1~~TRINITY_DN32136_c0_g1_i1.p1  ORF type:complete len:415 (+),score=96.25 TRINITY_DN32136_c0_g1_i1:177-1421(+)